VGRKKGGKEFPTQTPQVIISHPVRKIYPAPRSIPRPDTHVGGRQSWSSSSREKKKRVALQRRRASVPYYYLFQHGTREKGGNVQFIDAFQSGEFLGNEGREGREGLPQFSLLLIKPPTILDTRREGEKKEGRRRTRDPAQELFQDKKEGGKKRELIHSSL